MSTDLTAYLYAFSSVLTFSVAAIGFTYLSHKTSALWMNLFKCGLSFLISLPLIYYFNDQIYWSIKTCWPFYVSGFIGLNIGDWLLLSAYKKIGPARTLMIFGFQPLIAGGFSYFVWNEVIYPIQLIAIIFFIMCLFLISYEKFKVNRTWEISGLLLALGGVTLDSIGVILTRHGFNLNPELGGLEAQYLRTLAAIVGFIIFIPFVNFNFNANLKLLSRNEKLIAITSSFLGTFLSIAFYMQAVKIGKLATVTSIVLADPMMSTFFESLWLKKWPTKYLWLALCCFIAAIYFLFYPQFN